MIEQKVISVLVEVLQIDAGSLGSDSLLLGAIPEFDSMAVVSILAGLEEQFDIMVDDDEIDADIFETVGTIVAFIEQKL